MKIGCYLFLFLTLTVSCITHYEQAGADGYNHILVVEGIITNGTTVITLSNTIGLGNWFNDKIYVDNAVLYVDREDGVRSGVSQYDGQGRYLIETPIPDTTSRYRLTIFLDEKEYRSQYLTPIITPEFTTSWSMDERWNVNICVSTYDKQEQFRHFLWTYQENWEVTSKIFVDSFFYAADTFVNNLYSRDNFYRCWKEDRSNHFILGSTTALVSNTIINKDLNSFHFTDERTNTLYCIHVKQNIIRDESYLYFSNLQKNAERTGTIFSPIPSEIIGNVTCVSHPNTAVIGYVDVSTTTERKQYISREEAYTEAEYICFITKDAPGLVKQPDWAYFWIFEHGVRIKVWMPASCLDCTFSGIKGSNGSKDKPSWWPNDHL